MTLPDVLLIYGVEYRRADRDAPATNHHADLVAFMEKVICYSIEMDTSGINWPRLVLDAHELLAKVKGT